MSMRMNTRHLIDPELLAAVDAGVPLDLNEERLPVLRQQRAQVLAAVHAARTPAADITCEELRIPGPPSAPDVRVLVYRPKGAQGALPAYLHMHGGGFIFGTPETFVDFDERFVREVGCIVVSVAYRLAPETRFPGAIEDCYAALAWMYRNAASLGIDPQRIAIGGESAGGGLAAALALLARDRGEVPVRFQLLIYPVLDDRTCVATDPNPVAGEFVWTLPSNRFAWRALLGREPGGDDVSPYAAPARATDLTRLPAAFISVGTVDLFVDEDIGYAQRLMRSGVPTELHVYPGAAHGFELVASARVAQDAMRDRIGALRRALHS
jgi:acetyl esterase/lipase